MGGLFSYAYMDMSLSSPSMSEASPRPSRVRNLVLRMGRIASAEARHKARLKLLKEIETYDLFNGICKLYSPQEWDPKNFKEGDIPMVGDRKERNRIASVNHRNRVKLMNKVLHDRLEVLERALEPIYTPTFDFDFPFDDECDVMGHGHGVWEFTNERPLLRKI